MNADEPDTVAPMRTYEAPVLRDLGRMADVTRKTGAANDIFFDPTYDNSPGGRPPWWPDFLCWPPGVPTFVCQP